MRKVAIAIAMILGCAMLASCAAASSAPTKPEYIAAADSVCDGAHADVLTMLKQQAASPNAADTEESFVRYTLIPRLKAMVGSLASIQTPAGDQGYLYSIYNDYLSALSVWYAYPTGSASLPARTDVDTRLGDYGLTGCVKVPEARPGDPSTKSAKPAKLTKTSTTAPAA